LVAPLLVVDIMPSLFLWLLISVIGNQTEEAGFSQKRSRVGLVFRGHCPGGRSLPILLDKYLQ